MSGGWIALTCVCFPFLYPPPPSPLPVKTFSSQLSALINPPFNPTLLGKGLENRIMGLMLKGL